MIQLDPFCCIAAACLILILPLDWLLSAVTAALVHEFCHILFVLLMGGRIRRIRISISGIAIECDEIGDIPKLLSILAGPAGSLCLFLFRRTIPKIAVCGLLHGLYNLLPVLPLDGGRLLQLLFYRLFPQKTDMIMRIIRWAMMMSVLFCLFLPGKHLPGGMIRNVFPVFLLLKLLPRKTPCKPSQIGVQ